MTNAQYASLDRQLRVRDSYTLRGLNIPPHMQTKAIAERFGVPENEIVARLRVLKTP